MAKKAKKRPPRKPVRRHSSRVERQRLYRRLIIWGAIGVAILVVGVLSYGLFLDRLIQENIIVPAKLKQPVAIVNGVSITGVELRARVEFFQKRYATQISAEQVDFVLETLIQKELIRQETARLGIGVTDEDVDQAIAEGFGYVSSTPEPTATPEATPTAMPTISSAEVFTPTATPFPTLVPKTKDEALQEYSEMIMMYGISDQDYREYVKEQLLSEALVDYFAERAPSMADQVQLRYLRADSQERADELAGRLKDGASFATLKEEVEADEEAPGFGKELQWYRKGELDDALGEDIAAEAFRMVSGVFSRQGVSSLYYAVEVVDHQVWALDDADRQQLAQEKLGEWLESQDSLVERLDYDRESFAVEAPTQPALAP